MEATHNIGPIPVGDYRIGPLFDDLGGKGPRVMRLTPIGANPHGRDGFMIHGDNVTHTASEGCIILPRAVRETIGSNEDKLLRVVESMLPPTLQV